MSENETPTGRRARTLAIGVAGVAFLGFIVVPFLLARADGPVFIFAGGPFRSGSLVAFERMDWNPLDAETELELELVAAASSLTLWFSVTDGVVYVACDLDCEDGRLDRWPSQVGRDDRVVLRIEDQRVEGRLVFVPHDTPEYAAARADRNRKYAGDGGLRAAAETAAHGAVVDVGETLTGRAAREEPGDRLFRFSPR